MIYENVVSKIRNEWPDDAPITLLSIVFDNQRDMLLFGAICNSLYVDCDLYCEDGNYWCLQVSYPDTSNIIDVQNDLISVLSVITEDNINTMIIQMQLRGLIRCPLHLTISS